MKRLLLLGAFGLLFSLSAPVFAGSAYVGINLVLRAGPDIGYPRVMMVPAGSYLEVYGCVSDYTWCDVGIDGSRGWVAATYLQYYYGDNWVYMPAYAPRIGVPIVTFVLGTYWGNHYRHTSWYRERDRWQRMQPRHRPAPHRTPSFHPRVPPPARPPARIMRQPGTTRPAARPARPAQQTRQIRNTKQSRNTKQPGRRDNRGGGH
jgi:uncharacterized protein YraI